MRPPKATAREVVFRVLAGFVFFMLVVMKIGSGDFWTGGWAQRIIFVFYMALLLDFCVTGGRILGPIVDRQVKR